MTNTLKTNNIGREVMIRAHGVIVAGTVIDQVAGTTLSKRVRIQTGEHAGEVVMPHEYEVMEFVDKI